MPPICDFDLLGLLGELAQRLLQRVQPGREQAVLPLHQCLEFGALGRGGDQFLGEGDVGAVGALGLEPAAAGENLEILAFDDDKLGVEQRAIKPDERLTGGDRFAVMDQDFGDDAAIGMLDDLTALFDLDLAASDDGAGDARRP